MVADGSFESMMGVADGSFESMKAVGRETSR